MKKLFFIYLLLFLFVSCKKCLILKKSVLIGKWKWAYTIKKNDTIFPNPSPMPIFVNSCRIEFLKKGKIKIYKNDVLITKNKTKFLQFETIQDTFYFSIELKESISPFPVESSNSSPNNYKSYILTGRGVDDIFEIYQYPYINSSDYYFFNEVSNVFIKE